MDSEDRLQTRRDLLRVLAGTGALGGIAGCGSTDPPGSVTEETSKPTPETGKATTSKPTPQSSTQTTTYQSTTTSNSPPNITQASATPLDNGQALEYRIAAEDPDLAYVAVRYAGHKWSTDVDGTRIEEQGRFTDLGTSDSDDGRVSFLARDTSGQEARAKTDPDGTAPSLSTVRLTPTRSAGTIDGSFAGEDDVGLDQVALVHNEETPYQQALTGQSRFDIDTTVDVSDAADLGTETTLTASLQDWNGNVAERDTQTYVRTYDVLEETRLDIGTVYILWAGDKFGECFEADADPMPAIGQYGDPAADWVRSRHIDQMQGYGITNAMLNFNGTDPDRRRLKRFFEADLANQIDVRPFYAVQDYRWQPDSTDTSWKDGVVPSDMTFIREHILERENTVTYEGRPVVNIWNAAKIPWADKYHTRIMDEWGSYSAFAADLRDHLRVDGADPFIVGGVVGGAGYHGFPNDRVVSFLRELDATSTWVAGGVWGDDNQATWEEVLPWVEQDFQGHREFTSDHDMEFIPMVFPGFDDRPNTCWGKDRYTPRSLEGFTSLLELAEEYRTTPMVDVATWNDWTEGTQIEPGRFQGSDYGTSYLESIQKFQTTVTVDVDTRVHEGDKAQRLVVSGDVSAPRGIDSVQITVDGSTASVQADGTSTHSFETAFDVDGGRVYELEITVVDTTGEEFTEHYETDHVPIYIDPIDTDRVVGAHYYPWYETGNHTNWTERTVSTPTLGEYAASDKEVIDQHLKWSLEHGIRWWSISWWGPDSGSDRVLTERILPAEQFDRLQFSILYETVGRFEEFDFDLDRDQARARLAADLEYLDRTVFDRDNYRRIDGRPVVYFYVSNQLRGDVAGAFSEATANIDTDPYILAGIPFGSAPATSPIGAVADGVTSYNPYTPRTDIEEVFHDRYEQGCKIMHLGAEASDLDFVPVVIPGFNDTGLPERIREDNPILSASPDRFKRVCEQVNPHLADAEGVLITSFNEWYENTQVEPSETYGEDYLDVTADRLATGRSSGFAPEGKQIRFVFNKTVQPASVNPDSSDHRELAFMAHHLSLHAGSKQVASYDIGVTNEEPLWLKGVFGPSSNDERTWRWWGGRAAETVLFAEGRFPTVDSAVLRGQPMVSNEIEADIYVDGTKTDHIAFGARDGADDYELSLTAV